MEDELENALQLAVRKKLYTTVDKNPGLHFREIQRRTGIATGALQYHLEYLQKKHLIRALKEGKFVRYYSIRGKQLGENQQLLSILRQDSLRKLLIFLIEKKRATNVVIARNIGLSTSTTFWHISKLMDAGVVEKKLFRGKTVFVVVDPQRVALLLREHKKSFLDSLVDTFVEVWQGFEN